MDLFYVGKYVWLNARTFLEQFLLPAPSGTYTVASTHELSPNSQPRSIIIIACA